MIRNAFALCLGTEGERVEQFVEGPLTLTLALTPERATLEPRGSLVFMCMMAFPT